MKKQSAIFLAALLLVVVSCGSSFQEGFREGFEESAPPPEQDPFSGEARKNKQEYSGPTVLVRASGSNDTVTDNFTLNGACGKFVIDWEATRTAPSSKYSAVSYEVYDTSNTDRSVERSGQ